MTNEVFIETLSKTMQQRIVLYCLMFVFSIAFFCAGLRALHADNQIKKKSALFFISSLFIIGYFFVVALPNIISIHKDIRNSQIVSIEGFYNFDATSVSKRSLFDRVYISTDTDSFVLELPAYWDNDVFPRGKYRGKIYYGLESEIIVGFQPDNSEEEI